MLEHVSGINEELGLKLELVSSLEKNVFLRHWGSENKPHREVKRRGQQAVVSRFV